MRFLGIDWGEHHHDLCLLDPDGRVLAARRITDGLAGVGELHELVAAHAQDPAEVAVGIETDRGLLVGRVLARAHQNLVWSRQRHANALRPAGVLPRRAGRPWRPARRARGPGGAGTGPHPGAGAPAHPGGGAAGAGRRGTAPQPAGPSGSRSRCAGGAAAGRARANRGGLSRGGRRPGGHAVLPQPASRRVGAAARRPVRRPPGRGHPAQPARAWGGAGGAGAGRVRRRPHRYATAKGRKAFAGTALVPRSSGLRTVMVARAAYNQRLADACYLWAFAALTASPGARRCYDAHRTRGASHHQALRALGNRLVGILHGCLAQRVVYQEQLAWPATEPAA